MSTTGECSGAAAKKTTGRRKIKIERIERKSNRQVTFSKRKGGLFKKAAQISVMSGADVAVMVLSDKGRPYSFANPSLDAVVDRYLDGDDVARTEEVAGGGDNDVSGEHVGGHVVEVEGKSAKEEMLWWDVAVEGMGEEELGRYKKYLDDMKTVIQERMRKLKIKKERTCLSL